MKSLNWAAALVLAGLVVTGCPLEDDEDDCAQNADCPENYVCDALVGICRPIEALSCQSPADCSDATCSRAGYCRAGDCSDAEVGCVSGYVCSEGTGEAACVPELEGGGGGGGQAHGGGGQDAAGEAATSGGGH
jgi:hypothetical protein